MKKLIYSNPEFSASTKDEIQKAKEAGQKLLDVWNSLNLPAFNSLFQLVHDPSTVYSRAVNNEHIKGKIQLQPGVSIKIEGAVVPDQLYIAARMARNHTVIGYPDLFTIENNKTVVVNELEAERLIHQNDIFAENEAQTKFARDVIQYVELSNSLTKQMLELPVNRMPAVPFSVTGKFFPIISTLKLESEYLVEIMKAL